MCIAAYLSPKREQRKLTQEDLGPARLVRAEPPQLAPPAPPPLGTVRYKEIADYDPVLRAHCRLDPA
jgi:hypothetical protein